MNIHDTENVIIENNFFMDESKWNDAGVVIGWTTYGPTGTFPHDNYDDAVKFQNKEWRAFNEKHRQSENKQP